MPRFFQPIEPAAQPGDTLRITGQDSLHIRRSLRMSPGELVTVCDGQGHDYTAKITGWEADDTLLTVQEVSASVGEPSLFVTLWQGLPKGDKMDLIVQKAVELGVSRIVPVVTSRSIAKPGERAQHKQQRWQKIANEAAGQCGRGRLPEVALPLSFAQALPAMGAAPLIACYEAGGQPFRLLAADYTRGGEIGLFIGPEGGISPDEIEALQAAGARIATLGPRILRCETAPLAALALLMGLTGHME